MTTKFKLIIRKGSQLMQAWATGYTTALHIARAYTDRGHDVTFYTPQVDCIEVSDVSPERLLAFHNA